MNATQGPLTLGDPPLIATLALDGNVDPNMENRHCAHPHAGRNNGFPWWQVTFDNLYVIHNVTIFNRISSYYGGEWIIIELLLLYCVGNVLCPV